MPCSDIGGEIVWSREGAEFVLVQRSLTNRWPNYRSEVGQVADAAAREGRSEREMD